MQPAQKTIVAVTPLPLDRDSRTLKQARSVALAGYRSIVVAAGRQHEITASNDLPIARGGILLSPSVTMRRLEWLRQARIPWVLHVIVFAAWFGLYLFRSFFRPLLNMPKADLYVLHECSTYPAVRLRALWGGVRFIYDAHDFYSRIEPHGQRPLLDRRFLAPFVAALERRSVQNAFETITVSDSLAAEISRLYGRSIRVVRNAHDCRLDRKNTVGLRARLALGSDIFLLVTVGNAKRGQALDEAVTALSKLPPHVHWAFVGAGYEPLRVRVGELGLLDRVHFIGRLPPDEIVPTISDADLAVIIYFGYSENYLFSLPNGFFQAISAGLPQIVPPLPEIEKLADQYGLALIVNTQQPGDIAEAVLRLERDVALSKTIREKVKHAALELSWEVEEQKFLKILESALAPNVDRVSVVSRGSAREPH